MDIKLLEASQTGNVDCLHQLLRENPFMLDNIAVFSTENPLLLASTAGHVEFVKEVVRLKPEFAVEKNRDGFSPMHMAAAKGYVEIVKELVKVEPRLCRLQGKEKKTPLHCAAIKGRVEVISVMLSACPDSVEDVTVQRDTTLHLAVKNNQFEVIEALVDRIREMNKEDMLNMKDEQGNTVLHLASWKKQRQASYKHNLISVQ